ncbi:hypothetical protein AZE42_06683 [Rhizopogon vesiculosus]|uniref:SH3 domain-containing protein n=1 Tax=Rhizopogon vesiculosus TaxID=180088 RepID=A0A1J8QHK8_9AGAM|nr:hypothetical protein AZE42_06683 [Rhizopogon vesiculosus]
MANVQKDQSVSMNPGLDALHSSPPFPSPGSSFLPPPTPGPHEFARPPSAGRRPSKNDLALPHNGSDIASPIATNGHATHSCSGEAAPNGAVSPPRASLTFFRSFLPRFIISMLNVPRSLFRVMSFQESAAPIPTANSPAAVHLDPHSPTIRDPTSAPHTPTESSYFSPDPFPSNLDSPLSQDLEDPRLSPQPPLQNHRLSTQSVTSLTSSRPAPPSPAISRRASGLSRTSSKSRSRPVSGVNSRPVSSTRPMSRALSPSAALSRTPSGRRAKDVLGMSAVAESKEKENEKEPQTAPTTEPKVLIKIRDFAFAPSDPRFSGEGAFVPRPNRPDVLDRRLRGSSSLSTSSVASSSSTEEEEQWEDENDTNGWGGFKWGLQKLQSGWGFSSHSPDYAEDFPSRNDFARNFGDGTGDVDDDDDEGEIYEEPDDFPYEDEETDGEPVLHPGLYRALYAFEPEGTAEMKLEEDQVVRVVGRGGGVGWAVAVKDGLKDTGAHALVPESYLEVVRLDGDMDD